MGRDSLSGDEKKSGLSYMGKESQKVSKGSSGKVIFWFQKDHFGGWIWMEHDMKLDSLQIDVDAINYYFMTKK